MRTGREKGCVVMLGPVDAMRSSCLRSNLLGLVEPGGKPETLDINDGPLAGTPWAGGTVVGDGPVSILVSYIGCQSAKDGLLDVRRTITKTKLICFAAGDMLCCTVLGG